MLRAMIRPVHEIAAEVIRKAGKDKPADAALREVLKSLRNLAPFERHGSRPDGFHLLPLACLAAR